MLSNLLTAGTKVLGLSRLINSGRPAFDGCYRVVAVGGTRAIEFFDRAPGNGEHAVTILPYRSGKIAQAPLGGGEVISGEFTGCVMATFREGGSLFAGHVDTNKDTSQRANWDARKAGGAEMIAECDTTGRIQAEHGAAAVILCVAEGVNGAITHHHVSKATHAYGFKKTDASPVASYTAETIYTVIPSGAY